MDRRRLSASIAAVILCVGAAPAAADTPLLERVMEEGRLLVGVRQFAQWLGAQVEWSEATRSVTLSGPRMLVVLQVDLPRAWVNGVEQPLDVPPRLIGGRVYVPLRFPAEAVGAQVAYRGGYFDLLRADGQTRRVHLEATVRTEGRLR